MAEEKRPDLISRKALISEYDRVHIGPPGGARKLMVDAPTVDAVEVVLCKDCKHFGKCSIYAIGNFNRYDFCSYGERRTDG